MLRLTPALLLLALASCRNAAKPAQTSTGAIVLGDSGTIVTETDSAYLSDLVSDITPKELVRAAAKPQEKTAEESPETKEKPNTGTETTPIPSRDTKSFIIDFGQGIKVTVTGITTKEFRQQNPEKDAGVSYAITGGDLLKSDLHISGLKNVKVKQRYQSYLVLSSGNQQLSLQNMGGYLSGWEIMTLKNSSGDAVSDLDDLAHLKFKSFSNRTLENAVRRAGRSARMSRADLDDWLKKIRRTRSANDAPCVLKLDNVQWQISGKTNEGRPFFKTIRIDI